MPNKNGQGPQGSGSLTGRGRGMCRGNGTPEHVNCRTELPSSERATRQSERGCKGPRGCGVGLKRQQSVDAGGMSRG